MTLLGPYEAAAAGLAAGAMSLPHCAAMCGPLSAVVCTRSGHRNAAWGYQLGRMVGYSFAGHLAGQFGLVVSEQLPIAGQHRLLAIMTGLALLALAMRLLPLPTVSGLVLPERLVRGARAAKHDGRWRSLLPRSATLLGGLSALLPCGALLSGLLLAAGSGGGLSGAFVMLGFALASGPALWASARVAQWLPHLGNRAMRASLAAALVVAGAFFLMPRSEAQHGGPHESAKQSCH